MPSETQRIDAALTHLAAQGETAAQIADTAVQTWHEIHIALSPVIGPRGVQALYRRTLYLTRSTHPWLASGRETPEPDDYADLRAALAQQTSAVAAAAHGAPEASLKLFNPWQPRGCQPQRERKRCYEP